MSILRNYYGTTRAAIFKSVIRWEKITFEQLGDAVGLPANTEWSAILDPMSRMEAKLHGHDPTWAVVYGGSSKMAGLSPYFSDVPGGEAPRTHRLDPWDQQRVAEYERRLREMFAYFATRGLSFYHSGGGHGF
jgi:hypothetical protein